MCSLTRSPMVRRIKRLRILPEICARTKCSLASATRNIVPGRTDMIIPSSSIAFFGSMMSTGEPAPKASGAGSARSNYLPAAGVLTVARWTRTLFACARFVNRECAPGKFLAVERRHGRASFSIVVHGDERKTARFAGHAVHHQRDFADFAVLFEKILKIIFGSLKGEISYI